MLINYMISSFFQKNSSKQVLLESHVSSSNSFESWGGPFLRGQYLDTRSDQLEPDLGVRPREPVSPKKRVASAFQQLKYCAARRATSDQQKRRETEPRRIALPDHDSSSICVSSAATSISWKNVGPRGGGCVTRLENTIDRRETPNRRILEHILPRRQMNQTDIRIFIRNLLIVVFVHVTILWLVLLADTW